jgi:histidinol-phosphate aminotransferase
VYGLAGIRIGYGFAHDALIRNLLKVKLPFEPSTLASAAGIGALADAEFLHRSLAVNAAGKKSLGDALTALGLGVVPTDANFFCVPLPREETVNGIFNGLLQHGVIVRPLKAFGLPHCLRITIGTPEQNAILLAALEAVKRAGMFP